MFTKLEALAQCPWAEWRLKSSSLESSSPFLRSSPPLRSSPWKYTTCLQLRLFTKTTLVSTSRTCLSRISSKWLFFLPLYGPILKAFRIYYIYIFNLTKSSDEDTLPPTPRKSPPLECLTLPPRSSFWTSLERSTTATHVGLPHRWYFLQVCRDPREGQSFYWLVILFLNQQ